MLYPFSPHQEMPKKKNTLIKILKRDANKVFGYCKYLPIKFKWQLNTPVKDAKPCHLPAVQIKVVHFSPPHLNVRKFKTTAKYYSNIKWASNTLIHNGWKINSRAHITETIFFTRQLLQNSLGTKVHSNCIWDPTEILTHGFLSYNNIQKTCGHQSKAYESNSKY